MANFIVWVVWFGAAFACIASALAVVSFRNPFFSALALIGNLSSLAVLYLLLGGEFVAAGQVLVYGGAVMVMFLFVIAYLGDRTLDPRRGNRRARAHVELQPRSEHLALVRLTGFDRPTLPHRSPDRVRGDVGRFARRSGRRRRARLARTGAGGRCTV